MGGVPQGGAARGLVLPEPLPRSGKIGGVKLDADGSSARQLRCLEGAAGAGKGVEDQLTGLRVLADEHGEQVKRLLRWVKAPCIRRSVVSHDVLRESCTVLAMRGHPWAGVEESRHGATSLPLVRRRALVCDGHGVVGREASVEHEHEFMLTHRHAVGVEEPCRGALVPDPLVAEVPSLLHHKLGSHRHLGEHEQRTVVLEHPPQL